ncbi:hypothetical protein DFH09DRAFT_1506446 [Mycena vulgaris]|nr:hypothetical protein DFH09DRAFT_1506446 [Mycena vulgaris]
MSLFIQGLPIQSVTFTAIPRTLLSGSLVSQLPAPRASAHLFTSTAGTWGPFSFPLVCSQSFGATHDVILGYDWAASFRDCLLHSGLRLPGSFDSWAFFSTRIITTFDLDFTLALTPNPHSLLRLPPRWTEAMISHMAFQPTLWQVERLVTLPLPMRSIPSISETPSINLMHLKLKLKLKLSLIPIVRLPYRIAPFPAADYPLLLWPSLPPPSFPFASVIHTIFLKNAGRNIFNPAEAKLCREAFYVLDKWTTDVAWSPSALRGDDTANSTNYIVLQHTQLCVTPIADIRAGEVVLIRCTLYRRDSFEHGQTAKVYGLLTESIKKLSSSS